MPRLYWSWTRSRSEKMAKAFLNRLRLGDSVADASKQVRVQYRGLFADRKYSPNAWVVLAMHEWRYGKVQSETLRMARKHLRQGKGLPVLYGIEMEFLLTSKKKLEEVLALLKTKNPHPHPLPTRVDPWFEPGDCLSVRLKNRHFGAVLVLATDRRRADYGRSLMITLDYMEKTPPDRAVFQKRKWLRLTHGFWKGSLDYCWYPKKGYSAHRNRIKKVANIPLRAKDIKKSNAESWWDNLAEQVIDQRKFNAQK